MRRARLLTALMVLLLLAEAPFGVTPGRAASGSGSGARSQTPRSTEAIAEATNQERIDALAEARAVGTLGVTGPIRSDPAPGWASEKVMSRKGDDWEPAVAADPAAPYVYTLHNRFGVHACRHCPDPPMILNVSSNGGRTFGPEAFICRCRGVGEQFDPEIEVVQTTGEVYAVWMNDWHVVFSKSSDHGVTWSKPVPVYGTLGWSDKPILTTSQDGQDVYVEFNGPTGGDAWISASHDAGQTFTPVLVMHSEQYAYAYGGYVAPDGTVTFTDISYWYTGPGGKAEGPTEIHAFTSTDGGLAWTNTVADTLELGTPCTSKACYVDFYDSGPALAGDANGHLVMVYNGAAVVKGPQTVYARSSIDGGLTWSDRVALSPEGVNAAFPAAVGTGDGDVRAWFADQRTGRWNIWYTASMDLGATWSRPVRISDATSGTVYKSKKGFLEFYGDYGEIAITSAGATFAIWGESESYAGPGGCWYTRQVPV